MKLTGTNSSIGLIVLIDYAHLPANTKCLSGSMIQTFVLTRQWRCGRPAKRLATASGLYGCHKHPQPEEIERRVQKRKQANACQLLKT
ncbi:hypothetical protein AB9E15_16720, partial [Rhizobium leguminosarum]|uniref:hypothetical protein n=1 Tax=Rhizobium leguminosarum TaxID=384 RepID=UPI003F9DBFD3